jgi:enoyl-CoA hydratase/carnithine racemase
MTGTAGSGAILLEELGGGVSRLTLNRPDRLNAVNTQIFRELGDAARAVSRDGTRALIVTGAGDRAFCAGYDLAEIGALRATTVSEFLSIEDDASGAVAAIHRLPFPVIAAVNGAASGGGLSITLAADIRLAVPRASFNAAFVRVGFSVGELGTSWMLTRLLGPGMAAELAFTGRLVPSGEALEIGLVNRIAPAGSLQDEALDLARALADPARSDRIGKRTLQHHEEVASYSSALHTGLADRP